jgi:hypothetical protein
MEKTVPLDDGRDRRDIWERKAIRNLRKLEDPQFLQSVAYGQPLRALT